MTKSDIPVSVSIDACIGELIPASDVVFVGADVLASTGHALCKAGTYPSALVARAAGVPFYIAADTLKFDTATLYGLPYRNEAIKRQDVLDNSFPEKAKVVGNSIRRNPAGVDHRGDYGDGHPAPCGGLHRAAADAAQPEALGASSGVVARGAVVLHRGVALCRVKNGSQQGRGVVRAVAGVERAGQGVASGV